MQGIVKLSSLQRGKSASTVRNIAYFEKNKLPKPHLIPPETKCKFFQSFYILDR